MSATKSFRKSQLIAFDNVAAGHDGVLADPSGELVIKPCKQTEIDFYESAVAHPDIRPYMPTFFGKVTLGSDTASAQVAGTLVLPNQTGPDSPAESGASNTTVIANDWAPSNSTKIQTDLAIVLENAAHGYKKPNILDVKLGARLWADDAPASKRAKLDKVAEESTSGSLGFRIAGMKTYQGSIENDRNGVTTTGGYKIFDKHYGRGFTRDNVDEGFGDYFLLAKEEKAKGPIRKVIRRFIEDLKSLQEVFENNESRMYSASLLFVYEGDREALQDAFITEADIIHSFEQEAPNERSAARGNGIVLDSDFAGDFEQEEEDDDVDHKIKFPAIQSLKLIDFAHAEWTPGRGADENVLYGIKNVIKTLQDIS